jgi:hypothetical protein
MMGTRPQTLTGLADPPVGLAAFLIDHDEASYEVIARVFDGQREGLTRDDVLAPPGSAGRRRHDVFGCETYCRIRGDAYGSQPAAAP